MLVEPHPESKECVSGSLTHTNALNKHSDEGQGGKKPAGVFAGNCAFVFSDFRKTLL